MIGELAQFRIARAHDWLVGMRGGEHVLDRLARLVGPTDLYTLVSDGRPLSEAISACRVRTSLLQRWPGASGRWRRHYLPLMPWAVGRLRVAPCDLLVSTSSCVMKGLEAPAGAKHVCYCHSPARYIWSQQHNYARGLAGLGLRACGPRFKRWDRCTADNVDLFIAPSTYIASRIRECFGRDSEIVPPPVRIDFFTPDPTVPREDFWLIAAALEPFKRIDLAVEAANRTGRALLVAGAGSQRSRLERLAGPTVRFLGWQGPEALRDLSRRARAFLFPSVEDFGIAPVEAMACGCPVAALAAGGALDTVTESTGALLKEQNADALVEALQRIDRGGIDPLECRRNAERFSEEAFDNAMLGHVKSLL